MTLSTEEVAMATWPDHITVKIELEPGDQLRQWLVSRGWTPPGQMPPMPPIEPHPFVAEQSVGRSGGCLLVVHGGRLCSAMRDEPVHRLADPR